MNDGSTSGDVYCAAAGSDENDGLSPVAPKAGLQAVLDSYRLFAGDAVYVDTGVYALPSNVVVGLAHGGTNGVCATIRGSTDPAGTVLDRGGTNSGRYGVFLDRCSYVRVAGLRIRNAERGVYGLQAVGCAVEQCVVTGCVTAVHLHDGSGQWVRNNVIAGNETGLLVTGGDTGAKEVVNNTFHGNRQRAFGYAPGYNGGSTAQIRLRNNIFSQSSGYCLWKNTNWKIALSDHNDFFTSGTAGAAWWYDAAFAGLADWRYGTGLDTNSISADPLFVNAVNGDFRLQVASECIDAGINLSWMFDALDVRWRCRILNGAIDIGAIETPFYALAKIFLQGAYAPCIHGMMTNLTRNILHASPQPLHHNVIKSPSFSIHADLDSIGF